jgi:hypothetical protein
MTWDFRLALMQAWIHDNPGVLQEPAVAGVSRDRLAHELAQDGPAHPVFAFAERYARRNLLALTGGMLHEDISPGTRPRFVAPGLELVRFFPLKYLSQTESGDYYFAPGVTAPAITLIMSHADGRWQVAGMGDRLFGPGWPPSVEYVVDPSD